MVEHVFEPRESSFRVQTYTLCYTITLSKIKQLAIDKAGNCCLSQNLNPGLPVPPLAKKGTNEYP